MPDDLVEVPVVLVVVGVLHRVAMSFGDRRIAWYTCVGPSIHGTAYCIRPFFGNTFGL